MSYVNLYGGSMKIKTWLLNEFEALKKDKGGLYSGENFSKLIQDYTDRVEKMEEKKNISPWEVFLLYGKQIDAQHNKFAGGHSGHSYAQLCRLLLYYWEDRYVIALKAFIKSDMKPCVTPTVDKLTMLLMDD